MNDDNTNTNDITAPPGDFARREHLGRPWADHWEQFDDDMRKLGLKVHECHGAGGWGGPAVTVPREKLPAVVHATSVKLDHHEVGEQVMLYPSVIWV